jgi:hypothetical protein
MTAHLTRTAFLLVALTAGCTAPTGPASGLDGSSGGKADEATEAACEQYVVWAVNELGPALEAGDIDAQGIEEALAEARCNTPTGYSIWLGVFTDVVLVPFYGQQGRSFEAYALADSPVRGDYDAYLEGVALSDDIRARAELLLVAKPSLDEADDADAAFAFGEWTGVYASTLEQVAQHIERPTELGLDSFVEAPMELNDEERAWLALVRGAAPRSDADGAYAAWFEQLDWYLDRALGRMSGFSHTGSIFEGLSDTDRAFFSDLDEARPAGVGDQDGSAFMAQYAAAISTLPTSEADRASYPGRFEEAELLEAIAPERLAGPRTYALWLTTLGEVPEAHLDRFLGHQPCAELDEVRAVLEDQHEVGLVEDVDVLLERAAEIGGPTSCASS